MQLIDICKRAKISKSSMQKLGRNKKDETLRIIANGLEEQAAQILEANNIDVAHAREKGVSESLVDRLKLTNNRIQSMADGLRQVAALKDPVGEIIYSEVRPNGLEICKKRVPIGVVGMIYESRPNVTVDAFGLCFKTGNVVILKGGSDAIESNKAIVAVIKKYLIKEGINPDVLQLIEDTDRETAKQFMRMNQYIDVLIPRGGAGLIRTVVENSTVPVIETGTGNCHVYVDEYADLLKAVPIIENAKTQRTGVCNACESLVLHHAIAGDMLPPIYEMLKSHQVEVRGDEIARNIVPEIIPASEEDWGTEYLDLIISVKIVNSIDDAIEHINTYNTGHSESIITEHYGNARKFLDEIDASSVYVNASTRFTDGCEFGLGAEIGISTQKLHARGPMGLEALTTTKYIIYGNGQVR